MYYVLLASMLYAGINIYSAQEATSADNLKSAQAAQTAASAQQLVVAAASTKQSFVETKENVKTLSHVLKDSFDTWMPDSLQNIIAQYTGNFDCKLINTINEPKLLATSYSYGGGFLAPDFTTYLNEENEQLCTITQSEYGENYKVYSQLKKWNCISGELISADKVHGCGNGTDGKLNRFSADGAYVVSKYPKSGTLEDRDYEDSYYKNKDTRVVPLLGYPRAIAITQDYVVHGHDDIINLFSFNKEKNRYRFFAQYNLKKLFNFQDNETIRVKAIAMSRVIAALIEIEEQSSRTRKLNLIILTGDPKIFYKWSFTPEDHAEDYKMYFSHDNKYIRWYPQHFRSNTTVYYQFDIATRKIEEKNEKFQVCRLAHSPDGRYRAIVSDSSTNIFLINNANEFKKIEIQEVLDNPDLYIDQIIFSQTSKYLAILIRYYGYGNDLSRIYVMRIIDELHLGLSDKEITAHKALLKANVAQAAVSLSSSDQALESIVQYLDSKITVSAQEDLANIPQCPAFDRPTMRQMFALVAEGKAQIRLAPR
jgi:WD40 repeat protein